MKEPVVIATSNSGKFAEIDRMLHSHGIHTVSGFACKLPVPDETGSTFVENALIKAKSAAYTTQRPAIADDSGLVVTALGGAPGIRSARYSGEHGQDQENIEKLLKELGSNTRRDAYFYCAMVFLQEPDDPTPVIAEGFWKGVISRCPKGSSGFGYDPIFYIPRLGCTAAELPKERKNQLSHRGKALRRLCRRIAKVNLNTPTPD